jgi:hypothetical protein
MEFFQCRVEGLALFRRHLPVATSGS